MDRRSWLWRRKSSEKSPGETESSGSISSPSERFSDEQAYSNHSIQSPDVTSKAAPTDDEVNDTVNALKEKLSAALSNINAKEELVKQHAKVAEEAVTGWETAEKEVNTLKQQLEAAIKKNSALEDRVSHLDGALKECLRELRQAREGQDKKILEAVTRKSEEWQSNKSNLERQLSELQAKLGTATTKTEPNFSSDSDLHLKLEAYVKENESLKLELVSLSEELCVRTLERDLSTKTAETASKQHLESIKKVARLESECRKLKSMARKSNESEPALRVSSLIAELDRFDPGKSQNNLMALSSGICLMDDFLEMEKLAALSDTKPGNHDLESDKPNGGSDNRLKLELEAMINRTAELEEKIEKLETEKAELELVLGECQNQLQDTEANLSETQIRLRDCLEQYFKSEGKLKDVENNFRVLQDQLGLANEMKLAMELELEVVNAKREETESKLQDAEAQAKLLVAEVRSLEDELSRTKNDAEFYRTEFGLANESNRVFMTKQEEAESELKAAKAQIKSLLEKVVSLEDQTEREKVLNAEVTVGCNELENEVSRRKNELGLANESKQIAERELKEANAKLEERESQLKVLDAETKSLLAKVCSLEDEAEREKVSYVKYTVRCKELENELSRMRNELGLVNESKKIVEKELKEANAKAEERESELKAVEAETKLLLAKVCSLEEEAQKERVFSADFAAKCKELEGEVSRMNHGAGLGFAASLNEELKIDQEKELAVAANKLAECQETIASLGRQLKSLATLEDFLLDPDDLLDISGDKSMLFKNSEELGTDKNSTYGYSDRSSLTTNGREEESSFGSTIGSSSCSSPLNIDKEKLSSSSLKQISSEKSKNGFGKLFSRSKSALRN